MPQISVILPLYNSAKYLHAALQSVFAQTHTDYEIIAIDDGSQDESVSIIESYTDPRLKLICHEKNLGLAAALNTGIKHATGEWLARQDPDDISLPERFAKQMQYLQQHPRCGLLGTHARIMRDEVETRELIQYPADNISLQVSGLFYCLFVHSSVMVRRSIVLDAGLYSTDPERNPPEDFDLWLRVMSRCEVGNIAEPLLIYRVLATGITQMKRDVMQTRTSQISCDNLAKILSRSPSECLDLVAAVRFDAQRLSPQPDWQQSMNVLRELQDHLSKRFIANDMQIDRAINRLKIRVLIMKTAYRFCGQGILAKMLAIARIIKQKLRRI